jgi:hypothetical protein
MHKLLIFLLLAAGCCPKITQLPPLVERDTIYDSIYVPQPPVVIPADEFIIGYSIQEICDSAWRANHPVIKASGERLQGTGTATNDSLKFRCREEELIIERDSLKKVIEHIRETEKNNTIIEKCPSDWPRWLHPVFSVLAVIGLISIALHALKRS